MRSRGFTLIEVLIALAIVAFGLAALFTTVNQTVRASDYLREKTLGGWIALNRISEARLSGQVPGDTAQTGTLQYAGNTWRWELKAIKTPVEGIVRLEARAAPESAPEDAWPGLATGFIGAAVNPPQISSLFKPAIPSGAPGKVGQGEEQNQNPSQNENENSGSSLTPGSTPQ